MSRPRPPSVIVFDVNETLLDITPLEPLFQSLFGEAAALRAWFAEMVLYSEALTLAGLYAPFADLGAAALAMLGEIRGVKISEADVSALRRGFATMPAHADVGPALTRLRAAGFRLVTLTNSAPGPAPSPLERAGLAGHFERSFTVDAVRRFKPARETYAQVAEALGVELSDLCMLACHFWDTLGAQAAGCRAAFVRRTGNAPLRAPGVPQPDIAADDMEALAETMIARWAPPAA